MATTNRSGLSDIITLCGDSPSFFVDQLHIAHDPMIDRYRGHQPFVYEQRLGSSEKIQHPTLCYKRGVEEGEECIRQPSRIGKHGGISTQ